MRGRLFVSVAMLCAVFPLSAVSAGSAATDSKSSRPSIGPAPAWALIAPVPAAPPATEGASTVDLLSDIQKKFTKDGDSTFVSVAYKIASPQGLGDAALQTSWDPALEMLTLHHYRIVRDGQAMDLLGDGSKLSIIQREENMENAALDGELTVTMQPTDVRVGDIIEISYTRFRRDPAMAGRSEALTGPSDGNSYGRVRFRFLWPDGKNMRWHAFPGIVQPKLNHSAAGNELVADLSNVRTQVAAKGAPARFLTINAVDISEFANWGEVSSTILPKYTAAALLPPDSPVKAQAARIAKATSDPRQRAQMALNLVQEQIRYLFLGMDDGGYVPAAADLTWSRRFGDCKGKAVLLVALLRELGIEAEPVLVNTERGDLLSERLPAMGAFDHVIVRATIAGQTYWMDGTRLGDTRLDLLRTPPYHFGLPVVQGTTGLITMKPEPMTAPSETLSLNLDASGGIDTPAVAKGEMRFRGLSGTNMRMKYAGLAADQRDQQLRELWHKNYDAVVPSSITTSVDGKTGDFVIAMTGTAKMAWYSEVGTRWYEVDRSRLGWKFETERERETLNKDAPFEIDYPDYWESRETIKLPAKGEDFRLQGGPVDKVIGNTYAFHREVGISGDTVTMVSSTRALASELPASEAEQFKSDMNALANVGVYVRVPEGYMATATDIAALKDDKVALAAALLHRGAVHFDRSELGESVADEDAAIAIDPDNAKAHAIRALALAVQGDAKAEAAADRALALDKRQALAWRAKGIVAFKSERYEEADANFSKQIEIEPDDSQGLAARASVRLFLERFADSLADADAALAIASRPDVRIVRAGALYSLGRKEEALAEADRAVAGAPTSEALRKSRADMRAQTGKMDLARDDYDVLIKQAPSVEYFLARAMLWAGDLAKRDADIDSAIKLDPRSTKALALQASAGIEGGKLGQAEGDIAKIAQIEPNSDYLYRLRLQLFEKQHKGKESLDLVNGYVAKHPNDPIALNERCWTKATMDIQLDTALADCNASLKLKPDSPATLDSRAFTNLKLGATDAALADYDAALKLAPRLPASLYGRAIAKARKGDSPGASADLAEARKLSPEIEARFAEYGLSLPPNVAAKP